MTGTTEVAAEFWWLGLMGIVMAVMILPYVLDRIVTAGLGGALGNPQDNEIPPSAWAERLKAAHYNCVENLAVFAPLTVAAVVSGLSSGGTLLAVQVFVIARILYIVIYALGIPGLRTLAFLAGWAATVYMALTLLGAV